MNGEDVLLDTNAFIYYFEGRSQIAELVLLANNLYYSVITEIELLSATHLDEAGVATIKAFLAQCNRVELTADIVEKTIELRRSERIKTPDAIVVATAMVLNVPLVSADRRLARIPGLRVTTDIIE